MVVSFVVDMFHATARLWNAFLYFPTRGYLADHHPTYCLLGFSAALAPKFHPRILSTDRFLDSQLEMHLAAGASSYSCITLNLFCCVPN